MGNFEASSGTVSKPDRSYGVCLDVCAFYLYSEHFCRRLHCRVLFTSINTWPSCNCLFNVAVLTGSRRQMQRFLHTPSKSSNLDAMPIKRFSHGYAQTTSCPDGVVVVAGDACISIRLIVKQVITNRTAAIRSLPTESEVE